MTKEFQRFKEWHRESPARPEEFQWGNSNAGRARVVATVAAAMSDAGAWKWLAVVPPLLFCISAFSNQVFVETQAI